MSYEVKIAKVEKLVPHPNADRLDVATVQGRPIVVAKGTWEVGHEGVYFPDGGQLGHEYCVANNLYRNLGGFVEENRRVKAIKLRGVESEGLFMPLHTLPPGRKYSVGDDVTEAVGAQKYYTPAQLKAMSKPGGVQAVRSQTYYESVFPKHRSTDHFGEAVSSFPETVTVAISEKLHGTSGRTALVPKEPETGLLARIRTAFRKLLGRHSQEYVLKTGSRNQFVEDNSGGYYANLGFRCRISQELVDAGLKVGEAIYYEIVGPKLFGAAQWRNHPDKEIKKLGTVDWSYGFDNYEIFVYNIVQDGKALNFPDMVARCEELGVKFAPLLDYVTIGREDLIPLVAELTEGRSVLDPNQIREGVVVRYDRDTGPKFTKSKSWNFNWYEGKIRDNDDYIDTEEVN